VGQITLTEGKPKVVAVSTVAGGDETELLRLAASPGNVSEHPLAAAIVDGAAEKGLDLVEAGDFESVTGKGVKGSVDGQPIAFGNIKSIIKPTVAMKMIGNVEGTGT
jgi:P-type Cu+ transporter